MIHSIINNKDSTIQKSSEEKLKLIFALTGTKEGTLDPRYPNVHVDPSLEKINQIQNKSDSTSTLTTEEKIQQIQQVYDEYRISNPSFAEKMDKRRGFIYKNAFKADVLRIFAYGETSIFYERSLTKRFSFELGLGFTYKMPININMNLTYVGGNTTIGQNIKMGYVSYLGFRAYLQKTRSGLSGIYVGPTFRYRHNNVSFEGHKGYDDILSFTADFGYQFWFVRHFGLNLYVGPGLSYANEKGYYKTAIFEGQLFTKEFNYYSFYTNEFSFYINAGVKIDLGW